MQTDEDFMRIALDMAQKAFDHGEKNGIGALIVKDEGIISFAYNNVGETNDPTAHAEINAIRKAIGVLGTRRLEDCTLYSTAEPCPMCFTAAWWARIPRLVYGATLQDFVDKGKRQINVNCEYLNRKGDPYQLEIRGEVLREECARLIRN